VDYIHQQKYFCPDHLAVRSIFQPARFPLIPTKQLSAVMNLSIESRDLMVAAITLVFSAILFQFGIKVFCNAVWLLVVRIFGIFDLRPVQQPGITDGRVALAAVEELAHARTIGTSSDTRTNDLGSAENLPGSQTGLEAPYTQIPATHDLQSSFATSHTVLSATTDIASGLSSPSELFSTHVTNATSNSKDLREATSRTLKYDQAAAGDLTLHGASSVLNSRISGVLNAGAAPMVTDAVPINFPKLTISTNSRDLLEVTSTSKLKLTRKFKFTGRP
jgi:hypothetical protein